MNLTIINSLENIISSSANEFTKFISEQIDEN